MKTIKIKSEQNDFNMAFSWLVCRGRNGANLPEDAENRRGLVVCGSRSVMNGRKLMTSRGAGFASIRAGDLIDAPAGSGFDQRQIDLDLVRLAGG